MQKSIFKSLLGQGVANGMIVPVIKNDKDGYLPGIEDVSITAIDVLDITINNTEAHESNFYVGMKVLVYTGAAKGQSRRVVASASGANAELTLASAFSPVPSPGDKATIVYEVPFLGLTNSEATDNRTTNKLYADRGLYITDVTFNGVDLTITSYGTNMELDQLFRGLSKTAVDTTDPNFIKTTFSLSNTSKVADVAVLYNEYLKPAESGKQFGAYVSHVYPVFTATEHSTPKSTIEEGGSVTTTSTVGSAAPRKVDGIASIPTWYEIKVDTQVGADAAFTACVDDMEDPSTYAVIPA